MELIVALVGSHTEATALKRRLLIQAGLAAASAGGLSALGIAAGPESPPFGRLPIGFLGVGHSHAAGKIKVVQESADWELVGICENDRNLRSRYDKNGVPVLSQEELLKRSQVVAVESDVKDHAHDARLALVAGRHVHLEKPPADTLEGFRELLALARDKHLLMQMGYMWRYHPGINTALEAARKGWLGEIYLVRGTINTQTAERLRPPLAEFAGGMLFELGSHLIDVMVRLMGRPAKITSLLKTHGSSQDKMADNTVALFEFPKAIGIISSSALQPGANRHRSLEILGTNGTAVVQPIEPPGLVIDLAKAAGPYQPGQNTVPLPPYRRYVDDFADLARRIRRQERLAVSPDEDLLVQEALIRACSAGEQSRTP